jgi:hypothetical protein
MQRIAERTTCHQAERHFLDGGTVLVSEHGYETIPVSARSVTHHRNTIDWADLVAQVEMWRNRYPNQQFYVVREVSDG